MPQYAGIGRVVGLRYYKVARDQGMGAAGLGPLLEEVLLEILGR